MIRAILLLLLLPAGCAMGSPPRRTDSPPPRVRCLADPHEGDTRPLFFLFCIERP